MEAIGAIASIIGVAGAGAKLSIVLFEFASTVGSAGQEVKQIGIEISLFCSVLKQLQSTLNKAKAYRYSLTAIETTAEILDQCQEIFSEIETIVTNLSVGNRGNERSAESTRRFINSVKWTFKKSKVQLLRTTLESCKVTLHIMLSTLEFAQTIATRRISTAATDAEDEREATMTQSLVIAHQCTIDTLQKLEQAVSKEQEQQTTETGLLSPPLTPRVPPRSTSPSTQVLRAQPGYRSPRLVNNQNLRLPSSIKDAASKRASVWINKLMFDESPLPVRFRRQTWGDAECTFFLDGQPDYFLQKWTDRGECSEELPRTNAEDEGISHVSNQALPSPNFGLPTQYEGQNISSRFSNSSGSQTSDLPLRNWHAQSDTNERSQFSPKSPAIQNISIIQSPNQSSNETPTPSSAIFKNFRIGTEDPCSKLLPAALKTYNIDAPWEQYALYVVCGDKERCLGMDEKPRVIFKELEDEGLKPRFLLREIGEPIADLVNGRSSEPGVFHLPGGIF